MAYNGNLTDAELAAVRSAIVDDLRRTCADLLEQLTDPDELSLADATSTLKDLTTLSAALEKIQAVK